MTTIAMNNLWTYLESLGLSNKNRKWLASKLVEPVEDDITSKQAEAVRKSFVRSMEEVSAAEKNGEQLQTLDDLINDYKNVN